MPAGARFVGRGPGFIPGRGFGNPWKVDRPGRVILPDRLATLPYPLDAGDAVRLHESWLRDGGVWTWHLDLSPQEEKHLRNIARMLVNRARSDLRGRDLACWCALDTPCHADTWLRIANG